MMPNLDNLRACFEYCKNKKDRDASMSSDGDAKEKSPAEIITDEIEHIMEALSVKGDVVEGLTKLFEDKEKIKTEGQLLKQVFLEVIFVKYGTNSLEKIEKGVEKVKPILQSHYLGQPESQRHALDTIFKAFNMDQLGAQDFSKENLFMHRHRVVGIVLKLQQLGVFDTQTIITWCLDTLDKHDGDISLNFTHCNLILQLLTNV